MGLLDELSIFSSRGTSTYSDAVAARGEPTTTASSDFGPTC